MIVTFDRLLTFKTIDTNNGYYPKRYRVSKGLTFDSIHLENKSSQWKVEFR